MLPILARYLPFIRANRERFIVLLILAFFWGCTPRKPAGPMTSITLDGQGKGLVFDGIGAVSAGASSRLLIDYPEPYRSQILDYLFKPDYGASLQHLKVEIGSDVNSTDGSEPSFARTRSEMAHPDFNRGYEWWLMEEARERNPKVIFDSLAWGAPGWIGNGRFYSRDMANSAAEFVEGGQKAHNLDIQYTGVWNETRHDPAYVKMLHETLLAHHLLTRIVCCDETPREDPWSIVGEMKRDPSLRSAVAVVGVHYPLVHGHLTTTDAAKQSGKPLWATEDQGRPAGKWVWSPGSNSWSRKGGALAHLLNINYIEGRLTATEIWSPITSYYDILAAPRSGLMTANTPWSGHYELPSTLWAAAQTTQFAKPGWHYIDSACGDLRGQGTYVTLKSPSSNNYSIIVETVDAKEPQRTDFHLTGGLSQGTVHVWETNARKTFEHVANLQPRGGSFTITLDPDSVYSLTTTTGQHKGTATPPPAAAFPFPYTENLENTKLGQSPRYLADQDGAFEVHPCTGRPGHCLEQMITRKPIPWGPLPDPYTLLGSTDWKDYTVSVDAMLEGRGEVTLLGRIDDADVFKDGKARWPSCYALLVGGDGHWELMSTKYKAPTVTLASGKISFPHDSWHRLQLAFKGSGVEAKIDKTVIAHLKDATHSHGMVAIGTGWNDAEFDNYRVW